jgi:hypothetical protein
VRIETSSSSTSILHHSVIESQLCRDPSVKQSAFDGEETTSQRKDRDAISISGPFHDFRIMI